MLSYSANSGLSTAGANKKASNAGQIKDGANISKVEGMIDKYITVIF